MKIMRQMNRFAAGTIVSKCHLSLGRVVANSFVRYHPDIPFFLLLADEVEDYFKPEEEPYQIVHLSELRIPRSNRFRFRYSRQELGYAVTPYFLAYLVDQGHDAVIFIKE